MTHNYKNLFCCAKNVAIFLMLLFALNSFASEYSGSDACEGCHTEEYNHWRKSHHFDAVAKASDATVKGNFNDSHFTYNGVTSRFYRKNGKFYVSTDNAAGVLEDFEITGTFGIYPLQQYLIDFPDGRKQVLSIIWDTRTKEEGGQRWYHLFPESPSMSHGEPPVTHDDQLHWTGIYFNWNSRCASCHSTELQKGYVPQENRYNTHSAQISVGCEACHGPAKRHLEWVRQPGNDNGPHAGFGVSLMDPGIWKAIQDISNSGAVAATLQHSGPRADVQMQQCASCHSRRLELGQADPRTSYYNTHLLSLLEPPLYYADGQVRDEVFEWGSFLQSKMYGQGVTCTNCHDPHSLQPKAEGNALCTQCHRAAVFDTPKHHHHSTGSAGSQCANCHMPTTTFMGVDKRRDHSIRIPRPEQSAAVGAPNACNQCHTNQTTAWAQTSIEDWLKGTGKVLGKHPFADAFHAADQMKADAGPRLLDIALDPSLPPIARASAILRHAPLHSQQSMAVLSKLLDDSDPLIRLGALRSMSTLPLPLRFQLLTPHVGEQVMSLRVEIARLLAGLDLEQIDVRYRDQLNALYNDFIQTAAHNADMPESLISLGNFYIERKDLDAAEKVLNQAVIVAPLHEDSLLNLADFYRRIGRDSAAAPLLERAVTAAPDSPAAHYAMGLFHVRQQNYAAAENSLRRATELAPALPRYAYTYALALGKLGRSGEGAAYLEQWAKNHASNAQVDQVLKTLQSTPSN